MAGRLAAWRSATAVYRERPVLLVLLLGFSSGLPLLLTGGTLSVRLTEVGVDLTTIGLYAAVGLPYSLKILWAPFLDRVPVPWLTRRFGQRRGWLLLTQLGLVIGIIALGGADPVAQPLTMAGLALAVSFLSASQDILVDAFRIESLTERQMGPGSASYVFGYRIAILVAGAGALYAAARTDWQSTYLIMAACILVGVIAVLIAREPGRVITREARALAARGEAVIQRFRRWPDWCRRVVLWFHGAVWSPLAEFVGRKDWLAILLFIMLFKFGDTLAGQMANPFYIMIGFSKDEIATVAKLFGLLATLAGFALGGAVMARFGVIGGLWISGVLQLLSNFTFAAQAVIGHDLGFLAFTIGFENLSGGMGTAAFIAYMSALCNVSFSLTQYAVLTSVMALARTVFVTPSGALVERVDWAAVMAALSPWPLGPGALAQVHWVGFFTFTALAAIPGLLLLAWLSRPAAGPPSGRTGESPA